MVRSVYRVQLTVAVEEALSPDLGRAARRRAESSQRYHRKLTQRRAALMKYTVQLSVTIQKVVGQSVL